jgi:hypothetical protein
MGAAGPDQIFSCRTCGNRVYGPERVGALVAQYEAAVQASLVAEKERQRLLAIEAEAERLELGRKREVARILSSAKCAWPPCPNDHTMTSKYCSRTCTVKNAHARDKARRQSLKSASTP